MTHGEDYSVAARLKVENRAYGTVIPYNHALRRPVAGVQAIADGANLTSLTVA